MIVAQGDPRLVLAGVGEQSPPVDVPDREQPVVARPRGLVIDPAGRRPRLEPHALEPEPVSMRVAPDGDEQLIAAGSPRRRPA